MAEEKSRAALEAKIVDTFLEGDQGLFGAMNVKLVTREPDRLVARLSWDPALAQRPGAGIATGFQVALADSLQGLLVLLSLETRQPIATLELRCDHVATASADRAVIASATLEGKRGDVIFTTGRVEEEGTGQLLSLISGSFMKGSPGPKILNRTDGDEPDRAERQQGREQNA